MSTRAMPPGRQGEPAVPHDDGFREFAESIVQHIDEVFFWRDPGSLKPYFVSHAYERIWGQSCLSAYSEPSSWIESMHNVSPLASVRPGSPASRLWSFCRQMIRSPADA